MKIKVIALGSFSTSDATGVISAKAGDVLELAESTAERLKELDLVKDYKPKTNEVSNGRLR